MYKQINAVREANLEDVKKRFQGDVATHQLEILHEDGLYRHVRFARRDKDGRKSMTYYFDLVTWPGHLAIVGDMGGNTFCRDDDMFAFFRGKGDYDGYINPSYWSEKIVSGQGGLLLFDEKLFTLTVRGLVEEREKDFKGLKKAVEDEFFSSWGRDEWQGSEDNARRMLSDFRFPTWAAPNDPTAFWFAETWALDFTDWSFHYLWRCHAIAWGISQYDKHKAQEQVE